MEIKGQSCGEIFNSNAQRGTREINTWFSVNASQGIITQDVRKGWRCRVGLATLRKDTRSFEMPEAHILLPYLASCVHGTLFWSMGTDPHLLLLVSSSDVKVLYDFLLFSSFPNALGLQAVGDFPFGSSMVNTVKLQVQWSVGENVVRKKIKRKKERKHFGLLGGLPKERTLCIV